MELIIRPVLIWPQCVYVVPRIALCRPSPTWPSCLYWGSPAKSFPSSSQDRLPQSCGTLSFSFASSGSTPPIITPLRESLGSSARYLDITGSKHAGVCAWSRFLYLTGFLSIPLLLYYNFKSCLYTHSVVAIYIYIYIYIYNIIDDIVNLFAFNDSCFCDHSSVNCLMLTFFFLIEVSMRQLTEEWSIASCWLSFF